MTEENKCPNCGSERILVGYDGLSVTNVEGEYAQDVLCRDCYTTWVDVFRFARRVSIKPFDRRGE